MLKKSENRNRASGLPFVLSYIHLVTDFSFSDFPWKKSFEDLDAIQQWKWFTIWTQSFRDKNILNRGIYKEKELLGYDEWHICMLILSASEGGE